MEYEGAPVESRPAACAAFSVGASAALLATGFIDPP
jgi:hypothetical protein